MEINDLDKWANAAKIYAEAKHENIYSIFCKSFANKHFTSLNGLKVLDAGCGDGEYTEIFREKGTDATGCDGSAAVIEMAGNRYGMCKFNVVDLLSTFPYDDDYFDMIFSNLVLMDIDPLDKTAKEFSRILKEKGKLFFSIVHPAFYLSDWERNNDGIITHKKVTSYISHKSVEQKWGEQPVIHYHRPISFYFNLFAKNGLLLSQMYEPNVYEDTKIPDIPSFLFAELVKAHHEV